MNKCVVCNKEIKTDSQFIKDKWYHNKCIENLQEENKAIKERCEYLQRSCDRKEEQRDDARREYMEQEDYKSRNKKTRNFLKHLKDTFDKSDEMYELLDTAIFLLQRSDEE